MKKKLLNPQELKRFRLQQEQIRAAKLKEDEKKKQEGKKLKSPKELFDTIQAPPVIEFFQIEYRIKKPKNRVDTF